MTTSSSADPSVHRAARARISAFAAALLGAAVLASCSNPLGVNATLSVRTDTLSAYAMTGTPATYPAALDAQNSAVVRIGSDVAFDVAFDFTSNGQVLLVPARQVSATSSTAGLIVTSSRTVGLQKSSSTFESITKAPTGNYTFDSLLVVGTGVPVVMQLAGVACTTLVSTTIYAKIVIDSINLNTRRLFFRSTVDPNCGFRSFQPGIPKS